MAVYNNSKQTEKGRILENRVRAGEGLMEFTCIKTGAGVYTEEEKINIRYVEDLKEEKQMFSFSGIHLEEEDYLILESVIQNEALEEGYYLTELGIYARLKGSEEEILYCVCLVDNPDYMPPQIDEKNYEIELRSLIKCYDAEHVTIKYQDQTFATAEAFMGHVTDIENPHGTTKEQVGLGKADNTSDVDKPVSTAQQAALDAVASQAAEELADHTEDTGNPHEVTAAQIGLGAVDNTADTDKPVSMAQQAAIDGVAGQAAADLADHTGNTGNPHRVTADQIGLGNVDNTSDTAKPVSTAQQAALDALYEQLTAYTRAKIADLIGGAPTTMDTLKEISDAIAAHKTVTDALDTAIGGKASAAEFDSHTKDKTAHVTEAERASWTGKMEKTGDASNTTATFTAADTRANIATGEKLSIILGKIRKWFTDLKTVAFSGSYNDLSNKPGNMTGASASAAGSAGFAPAPAAGAQNKVLKGNATWDLIENLPAAFTQAASRSNLASGETLKTSLGKAMKWFADLANGAASSLLGNNLTANRALVSNGSGKVSVSAVSSTELGYLDGVTGNIQEQISELNSNSKGNSGIGAFCVGGVLVQYGWVSSDKLSNHTRSKAITLPKPYSSDTFAILVSPIWNGYHYYVSAFGRVLTNSSIEIVLTSCDGEFSDSNGQNAFWITRVVSETH